MKLVNITMRIAFVVFGLSSFHLAYQYVGAVSEKIPTK